jgi:hypothetical protein
MDNESDFGDLEDLLRFDEPPRRRAARQDPRLLTTFRVGKLITDRFEELCLIRNIGVGGLMAHIKSPVIARQRVRIELRSDRRLWGTILWVKDGTVGIGFDGQIDIEEVLARTPVAKDDRRTGGPRLGIDSPAKLRIGASYHQVTLNDLGQGGAGILFDGEPEEDQDVVLTLEGLPPLHGAILWCRDGRAGIAFNRPIPFNELTGWLERTFGKASVERRRGTR